MTTNLTNISFTRVRNLKLQLISLKKLDSCGISDNDLFWRYHRFNLCYSFREAKM